MQYAITAVSLTIPNKCDTFVLTYKNMPTINTNENTKNNPNEKSTAVMPIKLSKL